MTTPAQIVIIMEGGLITSVITTGQPAEVLIVDYDIEGADEDRLLTLDEDGPAYCTLHQAEADKGQDRWARRAFEQVKDAGL